jgi:valyl-tRNA synthetase
MEPRYDANEVESRIYEMWEEAGYFDPDACTKKGITKKDAEVFSIVLPPPNVTGTLHMGHAAMLVIEDIMVRFARMNGKRTLWIPGTDHAAIATQSKVEKDIVKAEGKNRHDLGREEFLKRVRAFAQESHDTIVNQVKRMGASLDWSREAYTLDDKREVAVRTAFQKMYDLGLIYRGHRVINWDVKGQTTISDDEIVYEERKAKLYTFRYGTLADGTKFPIAIATTRLETKFGDTAVAVHPSDERYKQFVGKEFDVDYCGTPIHIKVIADESVEKDFGTGALGVTPAHSMVDWEIAQRHSLPFVQIIDEYGKMTVENPLVQGKKTAEAREIVAEELHKRGLIEKEEEISQNVATAERTGGIIEPLPKLQWFVAVNKPFGEAQKTLKELMKEAVTDDGTKILPERFERIYFNWIDNLRDWCISRQIWFGHRIPAWYCMHCGEPQINIKVKSKWFLVRHGQTDWNKEERSQGQPGAPLNETGRAQARATGEMLKGEKIDLIISSDLSRAHETAEIIGKVNGVKEIILDEALRERHFGEGEGMIIEERNAKYGDLFHSYDQSFPGGETFEEVERRAVAALHAHRKNYLHKNVVIVAHGGTIRALQKHLRNIAVADFFNEIRGLDNAEAITLEIGDPCPTCNHDLYEQDPDTLDTWFSSGLWPFSTLGWPEKTADLKTYFPNSVLETGYDIIFFWVARMILMSEVLMGEAPFKRVYLHGLVRDDKGRKMSKSLGNIIDPLTMADKYGADATRLSLVIGAAAGNDIKLSEDRVRGYRNFSTKLWNIARFIQMNMPMGGVDKDAAEKIAILANHTEIKEFTELKNEVTTHIDNFEFHLAGEKLYHYVWHRLADEIIEEQKSVLQNGTITEKIASYAVLETLLLDSLKMLHPFMPFITEELWQIFRPGTMLMVERW